MPKYSSKKRSPFGKALVLLIGFIFALIIIHMVTQTDIIGQIIRAFELSGSKYDDLLEFTQKERDSTLVKIAGFWTYASKSQEPFKITDKIELKTNGYIWRVEECDYILPSGMKKNIIHASHEFLYPSSGSAGDASNLNCVIRTFQQLWIQDGDTCVVRDYAGRESEKLVADIIVVDFIDKVYDIFADGKIMNMYGRKFDRYSDSDLSKFFPEGVIELIYDLTTGDAAAKKDGYKIAGKYVEMDKKKNSKSDESLFQSPIKKCPNIYTLENLILQSVNEDLQNMVISQRDHDDLVSVIKKYHLTFCFDQEIISGLRNEKRAPKVQFSFTISWKGETENISVIIPGRVLNKKWIENNLILEIEKWKFQRLEKEGEPFKVSFVSTFER